MVRALWLYRRIRAIRYHAYSTFRDSRGWVINVRNDDVVDFMAAEHWQHSDTLGPEDVLTGVTPLSWTVSIGQMRNIYAMIQDTDNVDDFLLTLAAHTPAPQDRAKVNRLRAEYLGPEDEEE